LLFSEWIDERGMTRAKAARLLGVTPTAVTHWYHGTHRPGAEITARIYELTGGKVTVNDLHRSFQMARNAE
jgi:DNA-binding transcriptional regulator YdaS (Cro superfamily)